jgi:cytochrome P450
LDLFECWAKKFISTATTWALYELTKNKEIQAKLREELAAVSTDSPTMDELNSLPYLDTIVRETLRLHAPVSTNSREATTEDVLPLENPVIDRNGKTHYKLR